MGSSRLPGKMMADVGGRSAVVRVIERLMRARFVDAIVLATSVAAMDDVLVSAAGEQGIDVFRGSEDDVLGRVAGAHRQMETDIVVQICGDCPLIDPDIIDQSIATFLANDCHVVTTGVRQSYPQGTEVSVFPNKALAEIDRTSVNSFHREHVALGVIENPNNRILHLMAPASLQAPELRLQLDYPEDLALIRRIYQELEPSFGVAFGTGHVLSLFSSKPELALINRNRVERQVR